MEVVILLCILIAVLRYGEFHICEITRKRNRVHFYVARDKSGFLGLFLCKPEREDTSWMPNDDSWYIAPGGDFEKYGLNEKDFDSLSWEDKPIEVYIKMN